MNRHLVRLVAVAALAPAVAHAQRCGDTLHASTTLTNDIVCPVNAPFGLRIASPNVRLDMNGHSIVVPTSHPSTAWGPLCATTSVGVEVLKADGVVIHGGRIETSTRCGGFGVRFVASDRGGVHGVVFDTPDTTAVSIEGSSDVVISDNNFNAASGVIVWQGNPGMGRPSARARIVGNVMPSIGRLQAALASIASGADAADSVIEYNDAESPRTLINVGRGNDNVRIVGNIQRSGPRLTPSLPYPATNLASISVVGSNDAVIVGNWVDGSRAALQLESDRAFVAENHLSGFDVAIEIGAWSGASDNVLRSNFLTTTNNGSVPPLTPVSDTGLWFGPHASANDGRGNRFGQVATPVVDQGSGNIY